MFDIAARELRWHYQAAMLRESLPTLIGSNLVDELLRGAAVSTVRTVRRSSHWNSPTRPIGTAMPRFAIRTT